MDATALARELADAHAKARTLPPLRERYPGIGAAEGYGIARALHRHRLAQGWRAVGRKIGFTNRTLWPRYGVHEPMWGTVYEQTLTMAVNDAARVTLQGLVQPRIEPEICFRLKSDIREKLEPRALLGRIEWVAHSVEIVQCHHPDWKVTIADCCADNGLHGRLVVGTPLPIEDIAGLEDLLPGARVDLCKGKTLVERGVGANVLGSPLAALGFLLETLARQADAEPLAAGEIVTTGTLTDAHPVAPGETWHTAFAGLALPGLEIAFE